MPILFKGFEKSIFNYNLENITVNKTQTKLKLGKHVNECNLIGPVSDFVFSVCLFLGNLENNVSKDDQGLSVFINKRHKLGIRDDLPSQRVLWGQIFCKVSMLI